MDHHRRPAPPPFALWGGVECTVNRVGDRFFDQLVRSGHDRRLDDLDRFAALGVRALRYPVLWERVAPDGLARADWRWTDERLARLRELGIRPIVTLLHHGSGPRSTNLLDPAFPDGLAAFAGAVAERYPWVEDYTPVNEPFTTARFSALYGHWYPHARDMRACVRALVNELEATRRAMRALRRVNPAARLIQTEDLGRTSSTPALAYQAEHENERRWLTFDILTGRVGPAHPLWAHLWWLGLDHADFDPFLEEPCPPDVIGINHYATSDRFLDERIERYPADTAGGNGRHAYADVEAVRVRAEGITGFAALLREAWDRYGRPVAITEVHLGCTREEQVRWLAEAWTEAEAARAAGADVRAVTVWSLLGAHDWHRLLTADEGHYEPGVFDLRAPAPRPTALAHLARDLAAGRPPQHPVLASPGWWRRPERLLSPSVRTAPNDPPVPLPAGSTARPILLLVADDTLVEAFARHCARRALPVVALPPDHLEAGPERLADWMRRCRPWAVVTALDPGLRPAPDGPSPRSDPARAERLATTVAATGDGVMLLALSSAAVFDGGPEGPFTESSPPRPASPAAARLVAAEQAIQSRHDRALIVRAVAPLHPRPDQADHRDAAVHTDDLVAACLDLLVDGEQGIWHLVHAGEPSRRHSSAGPILASERGWLLPPLEECLARLPGERV